MKATTVLVLLITLLVAVNAQLHEHLSRLGEGVGGLGDVMNNVRQQVAGAVSAAGEHAEQALEATGGRTGTFTSEDGTRVVAVSRDGDGMVSVSSQDVSGGEMPVQHNGSPSSAPSYHYLTCILGMLPSLFLLRHV